MGNTCDVIIVKLLVLPISQINRHKKLNINEMASKGIITLTSIAMGCGDVLIKFVTELCGERNCSIMVLYNAFGFINLKYHCENNLNLQLLGTKTLLSI